MSKKEPIETFVEFTHMTDDGGFLMPIIKVHIGCSKLNYQSMITIANVQEVKHGTWMQNPFHDNFFSCSLCGRTVEARTFNPEQISKVYPYCHCGARMDGGDK